MHYGPCATVTVKSPAGDIVINESDFDPTVHERVTSPLPPPPLAPPPPPAPPDALDGLPKDWQGGDAAELKRLAAAVSGRTVENKAQAVQVINAALAQRAAK
jgi:hypothetical protein